MKRLTRFLTAVVAVIMVVSSVPFVKAAGEEIKTYRVPHNVVTSDTVPIVGNNCFAIGADIYDTKGDKIKSLNDNETVYSIGDNCILSLEIEFESETEYSITYNIYEMNNGKVSYLRSYDGSTTLVMPYEDGKYTTLVYSASDGEELSGYAVINSYGKEVYTENAAVLAVYIGEGVVVLNDESGSDTLVSGFDGTVTKKAIDGVIMDYFANGMATYAVGDLTDKENGEIFYGVINSKGEVLTEAKYAMACVLDNGYAVLYDEYDNEGSGKGIHIIDSTGKVVYENNVDYGDIIEYFGDSYIICDSFGTYALNIKGQNESVAYGYHYYSELDYHFFANDETTPGNVYDPEGNIILTDVLDFSTDGDNLVAKSPEDGKYHIYDDEGQAIYTYSAKTVYALLDGVVVTGNEYYENVSIVEGDRVLTSQHDYYLGGEIYDSSEVYLMVDVDEETYSETYVVYIITESVSPFGDVKEMHWAFNYILTAYENGIMNGTGGVNFTPNGKVSRAQVVTVLWRLAGEPETTDNGSVKFTDVKSNQWYSDAVEWASSEGIVNGVGGNSFAPDRPITRGELAALFYRYAEYLGEDVSAKADLTGFSDKDELSAWNSDAFAWCVAEGLINGRSAGTGAPAALAPSDNLTRVELATVVYRFAFEE